MAVYYRAIWADSQTGLIDKAYDHFCSWVREKSDGALSATGTDEQADDGQFTFRLQDEMSEDPTAPITRVVSGTLIEKRDGVSRWTTTLRMWQGPLVQEETQGADTWFWVDVDAVSHDSLDSVVIGAPRFVRSVIDDGTDANRRGIPLTTTPRHFEGEAGAEKLAELLTNMDRDVPVVVFSPPPEWFDARGLPASRTVAAMYREATIRAVRMMAGLALVCTVDVSDGSTLAAAIGESYSVRDGAFRIYLPGLDPALSEEWRHRYTVLSRYIKNVHAAGKLIGRAVLLKAGARRAPDSNEVAARLLEASTTAKPRDVEELLDLAIDENKELNDRIVAFDQQYLALLDEQQSAVADNNRLRHELNDARKKLALVEPKLWETHPDEMARTVDGLPADVDLPSEAVEMARQHLGDYLDFPEAASVDLQDIDTRVEARAWGSSSWRAFRALHAYAKDLAESQNVGTFWTWCKDSKHPLAWPATPKKLAMAESETIRGKPKLRAKRVFVVDERVDPSGRVFMEAHIKIAEGGGQLAPRIYFLTSPVTKKVHIGYFGPHRNVPNTIA